MHDLILILKRFIPPYKLRVTKSIIFNFLHAIFGSLSIAMLGPILKIIFNNEQDVTELVPFEFNSESIGQIFNYYITTIKYTYGPSTTLILIGVVAIVTTALKTGFAYLGAYELIYIRNGVVRDIRRKIYAKILSLPLPFFSEERKGDIIARMTGVPRRHSRCAARRSADRGYVRHRRQRHSERLGQGQGHGQGAEDPHRGFVGPYRAGDPADARRG